MRKFDENKIYMMKRTILLLSIMCLGMTMSAQSGIIESRKANAALARYLPWKKPFSHANCHLRASMHNGQALESS